MPLKNVCLPSRTLRDNDAMNDKSAIFRDLQELMATQKLAVLSTEERGQPYSNLIACRLRGSVFYPFCNRALNPEIQQSAQ